jgi:hypothetical protein
VTTVCYRAPFLAADLKASGFITLRKIFPLGRGGFVAGAGYYDQIVEIATWLSNGSKPEERPVLPDGDDNSTMLVIDEEGVCYFLTWPYLRPVKIDAPFIAIGSGSEFAMGAMAAGANAGRAVEIASMYDPHSGGGVQLVRCGPKKPKKQSKESSK